MKEAQTWPPSPVPNLAAWHIPRLVCVPLWPSERPPLNLDNPPLVRASKMRCPELAEGKIYLAIARRELRTHDTTPPDGFFEPSVQMKMSYRLRQMQVGFFFRLLFPRINPFALQTC